MPSASDLYFNELVRIDMPSVVRDRVVLIGDAASCGSPMTGMGTATALVGAYLLAARIAEMPGDLDAALRQYNADIAPFAEQGKTIPGGGIERMVPRTRIEAGVLRAMTGVMLSRPLRPLVKRMFDQGAVDLALPIDEAVPVAR